MKAILETLLLITLAGSLLHPMPWFGVIAPIGLVLTPLQARYAIVSWTLALASAGVALWAVISRHTEQPDTLVLLSIFSVLVAPRFESNISVKCTDSQKDNKFE